MVRAAVFRADPRICRDTGADSRHPGRDMTGAGPRGLRAAPTTAPDLSVVVTVVEGGAALTRCLEALSAQRNAPAMEVIVPVDDTIHEVNELAPRFPDFHFVDMGTIAVPDSA